MIAATVEAVVAQRLVRRVCQHCAVAYSADRSSVPFLADEALAQMLVRGAGCAECRQTGFRGRLGLFELFRFTDDVKQAVAAGADATRLKQLAERQGMRSLRQDGWDKVVAGLTTVEEVERVTHG
jgi:general secretion pathway protein E/type IV pilus assembly protein PilB